MFCYSFIGKVFRPGGHDLAIMSLAKLEGAQCAADEQRRVAEEQRALSDKLSEQMQELEGLLEERDRQLDLATQTAAKTSGRLQELELFLFHRDTQLAQLQDDAARASDDAARLEDLRRRADEAHGECAEALRTGEEAREEAVQRVCALEEQVAELSKKLEEATAAQASPQRSHTATGPDIEATPRFQAALEAALALEEEAERQREAEQQNEAAVREVEQAKDALQDRPPTGPPSPTESQASSQASLRVKLKTSERFEQAAARAREALEVLPHGQRKGRVTAREGEVLRRRAKASEVMKGNPALKAMLAEQQARREDGAAELDVKDIKAEN